MLEWGGAGGRRRGIVVVDGRPADQEGAGLGGQARRRGPRTPGSPVDKYVGCVRAGDELEELRGRASPTLPGVHSRGRVGRKAREVADGDSVETMCSISGGQEEGRGY